MQISLSTDTYCDDLRFALSTVASEFIKRRGFFDEFTVNSRTQTLTFSNGPVSTILMTINGDTIKATITTTDPQHLGYLIAVLESEGFVLLPS